MKRAIKILHWHLHTQLLVIQGDDPANAINQHTTQHNGHPTLKTVSIPHKISHFIHVLYDNGKVNKTTKKITLYLPQANPHHE